MFQSAQWDATFLYLNYTVCKPWHTLLSSYVWISRTIIHLKVLHYTLYLGLGF